jgi:two-component system OmpR family sensor kinase
MALRTRLVLVLVALVAIALAVIEPVTYITTRQSLISKLDSQLQSSRETVMQAFDHAAATGQLQSVAISPDTYAALYGPTKQLVDTPGNPFFVVPTRQTAASEPRLPDGFLTQLENAPAGQSISGSCPGTHGVSSFRVLGTFERDPLVSPGPLLLIVAYPLTGVQSTLGHVLLLEVLVGLLVLLALAVGSWFLVRLSLRPLEQMAMTASEIAGGDLTARIEDTDERTEVGQLGSALNTMLTKIERAFREKEASEDQLRRFVADASHELRTPLTSIRGYAELFRSGRANRPEDLAVALRRIESESSRMGLLVEDLLLLARLDQGRPLSRDPVDLTQVAADAVSDAGVVDPERAITLVGTETCVVEGDEARLRQVLGNLLSNALAYSPPRSPIEVHVQAVPGGSSSITGPAGAHPAGVTGPAGAAPAGVTGPAGGAPAGVTGPAGGGPTTTAPVARLAVVDHGAGIAPEDLAHIFDRFWRADPSRVRASGGTGLGLSIVQAVVSAHGGRVSVEPTPGGGATFVVELPTWPSPSATAQPGAVTGARAPHPPRTVPGIELAGGSAEATAGEAARR